jgi:sugar phosphate isomerase/epimerase
VKLIPIGTLVHAGQAERALPGLLGHGFECFSLIFWHTTEGVDLEATAERVRAILEPRGAFVSSLGVYGNPLAPEGRDADVVRSWARLIDAAGAFGTDLVGGFAGRLSGLPVDASIPAFRAVFADLAARAADRGVRLCFENCAMGGTWAGGDWNIAHHPDAWELMFDALPAANLGLEWEPCHQLVALVDPIAQLRRWAPRVFHVHGKDATIAWDVVREHGVNGRRPWAWHRTPGFGDTNWTDVVSILMQSGYAGTIDVEGWHDPVYRDELELTGQVHALRHLKAARGGEFVAGDA